VTEITAFTNKTLWRAYLLSSENCTNPIILTEAGSTNYAPWSDALWSFTLNKNELRRICNGNSLQLSPNRKLAVFLRSDEGGFHSLHLLDLETKQIETIMSAWESDPNSGISWEWRWSADSKAINIYGSCGGFGRSHGLFWHVQEFNFIWLVKEQEFFSIP